MSCTFGKSIAEEGPINFDIKFIQLQSEVATEELGDEFIEDESQILKLAGKTEKLVGEEYFLLRARSIIRCLQARYLGDCTIKECAYKKEISEIIEETKISTLST